MKNIQTIVNEHDEEIGAKPRSEIWPEDIYRVSALWVENSKWEVLMAQRGFLKNSAPGKWSAAVAGTIDEGETYDENIYKEAEEEIGLKGEVFEKREKIFHRWKQHIYFCQWYFLKLDRNVCDFRLEIPQVEAVRWFNIEEIRNILRYNPEMFTSQFAKMLKKRFL